jgi:hypothetical protein
MGTGIDRLSDLIPIGAVRSQVEIGDRSGCLFDGLCAAASRSNFGVSGLDGAGGMIDLKYNCSGRSVD